MRPPNPPNEHERARAVERYRVMGTGDDQAFEDLVFLAAMICETPMSLVTLIADDVQWTKASLNFPLPQATPRDESFCAHGLSAPNELLIVEDATQDPRFADNPIVVHEPWVRFYAGAPLVTTEGHALGALSVLDRHRRTLTTAQQDALRALSRQTMTQLEVRLLSPELSDRNEALAHELKQRAGREAELERLAALVEHSQDSIISTDPAGVVGSWNPGAEQLYGYSAAEMIGKHLEILIPPELLPEFRRNLRMLREGKPLPRYDTWQLRKDGSRVEIASTASPIHVDGELRAISWISRDVTSRRRADRATREALELQVEANEQLERVNAAKSNFVSIVSHDFRTPLTVIQGFAQMLASDDFSRGEVREYASDIYEEASRLGRLVNDMLDIARMESGRMHLDCRPTNLNQVFEAAARLQEDSYPKHRLVLDLDLTIPEVPADPDRIRQVATNLLSNAFKYSPGGGEVRIRSRLGEDGIVISVEDGGVGIDRGSLDAIFDRYARSGTNLDKQILGTGLGLSIVREIVRLHGGRVWAESERGRGATFHVLFPTGAVAQSHPVRHHL